MTTRLPACRPREVTWELPARRLRDSSLDVFASVECFRFGDLSIDGLDRGVAPWAEATVSREELQLFGGRRVVSSFAAGATLWRILQPASHAGALARVVAENDVLA